MWRVVANLLPRAKVPRSRVCCLQPAQKGRSLLAGTTAPLVHATQSLSMNLGIQKVEALDTGHFIRVEWEDGSESRYPCVWLRDNCQCPQCFLRSAKARRLLIEDLDVNIVVKEVAVADRRKISITWPDEHASEYEAEWLKKRCFSEEARAEMRENLFLPECQHWGSDLQLPKLPFEEVMYNDESTYKWLCTLKRVGIVLLTGAAARQGELVKLGHRIGFLRLTFYGPTWQVQDKADANNVAYTTGKLCFHTDYPVLQHPPGVQFLHCIKQTAAGGESQVVDGFHVSRMLKKQNPQAYQILTSTAVDYTDIGVDFCDFAVQCKQRIIDVDSRGEAVRINYNNATRDTVFDIPAEKVRPFYAALKEFDDLLNSAEHKFTYKLKPGDIVTFDNWRVLHGRQSFPSDSEVTRHLEGAYADWDVVMSRLRLLRKRVLHRD
ncbi:gamma-butyrobetaine dioxygenase isoform X1 [Falco biarmicus]|uniref:gamma-butyrobetaine dioxygenase isoform X1 n=1 Tax=Falco rusticolus TaxID=120794 RepID=UPI000FFC2F0B|nr:gamma-butyrobetaine dioxygenase isoform X1 [Falco rusticolus]XP_037257510.1 gamma-butyrobetaine dioxygenase isoform X1 [Falco rusticolus]XP_055578274.1 gamma-butyrobetaine dioxygenase isoform X1 [Falco cherrug]XP_055670006.1 gamma-butyrobetaine dioxygenase isoform X1 [Falco peregrinus]XP_056210019.1 gamma-butyrobetaine dioxygenase isoform X1 [Falco biarmicus]